MAAALQALQERRRQQHAGAGRNSGGSSADELGSPISQPENHDAADVSACDAAVDLSASEAPSESPMTRSRPKRGRVIRDSEDQEAAQLPVRGALDATFSGQLQQGIEQSQQPNVQPQQVIQQAETGSEPPQALTLDNSQAAHVQGPGGGTSEAELPQVQQEDQVQKGKQRSRALKELASLAPFSWDKCASLLPQLC